MYCSILNLYTYIYTYHMHMIQVSAEKTNSPIPIASRNCASIPFCFAIWRKNRRIQSWNPVFFQSWDDIIDIIWWHPHMWLPQFWKELAPSLKTSFSPQHGYTVLPIHSTYSCEEKMALAFRNETNPEPLGTLSGHKPRGSCEPCGCFPVPSCTQIFHQQKKHVTGVFRKTPDAGIVFHHCVKDFQALQAGQGDQTFVIDRCIHAWKLLDNIAPPEVPAQPLEPL